MAEIRDDTCFKTHCRVVGCASDTHCHEVHGNGVIPAEFWHNDEAVRAFQAGVMAERERLGDKAVMWNEAGRKAGIQAGREAAAADVNAMDADDIGDLIHRVRAVAVARGDNQEPCNDCKAGDHFACQQEGPDPNYCGCYRRGHGEQR